MWAIIVYENMSPVFSRYLIKHFLHIDISLTCPTFSYYALSLSIQIADNDDHFTSHVRNIVIYNYLKEKITENTKVTKFVSAAHIQYIT